jgi:hypothetical protein
MLFKFGETHEINFDSIKSYDDLSTDSFILNHFQKVATDLKAIAPRAKDFLYFTAVMMHAAEHALLNDDGTLRKDAAGKDVTSDWEIGQNGSWKWVCSDSNIKAFKNSNGDIFPAVQLQKYHKDWVGKPLCLDHKSSSVDMIRGVIVDTYYDLPNHRVVSLCALDKVNYPDLARKVESKYAACVSMGVGVGKAICYDCQKVASNADEFCYHMKNKSCYGEINIDLKPIELSIVVNGADPKAKIRNVIASANSLSSYIELKEKEFEKSALMHEMVEPTKISAIKKELESVLDKLRLLEDTAENVEKIEKDEETGQHQQESKQAILDNQITKMAQDINKLKNDMSKLSKEDKNMTEKVGYFQGGGDVNEPTPGTPKYEKEPYQPTRDGQDKQMVGQMDTGPVDGMHPGYKSFGETEEARKKRLQRLAAEQQERSMRRQAALESAKRAYHQGGGDVNEPTPGKPKYKPENYTTVRDKEDKQMVGQSPFPGVGSIDGLHPSPASVAVKDELKRKQMLSRAKLEGKFHKAGNPTDGSLDKKNSAWQVFADKKLILTATVDEITSGKSDILYSSVASPEFGKNLLSMIRSEGYDKTVASLKKHSQEMPAAPPVPAAPPGGALPGGTPSNDNAAPEMDMPEMPEGEDDMPEDLGGSGDPSEKVNKLIETGGNWFAELAESIEPLLETSQDDLDELSGLEDMPKAAQLNNLRVKTGKAIAVGVKKVTSELGKNLVELKELAFAYNNRHKISRANFARVNELAKLAIADTEKTLENCKMVMRSYANYAEGIKGLMAKTAQSDRTTGPVTSLRGIEGDPLKGIDGEFIPMSSSQQKAEQAKKKPGVGQKGSKVMKKKKPGYVGLGRNYKKPGNPTQQEMREVNPGRWKADNYLERTLPQAAGLTFKGPTGEGTKQPGKAPSVKKERGTPADDMNYADNNATATLPDGTKVSGLTGADVAKLNEASREPDLTTKEGRAEYRSKLAQQGVKFSDLLDAAHPQGGNDSGLKASNDLANVETLEEAHEKMMQVSTAPVKVRKDAEEINKLVVKGAINPDTDFDMLIEAGLDPEAVKYWKTYYGQAGSEGSQFASELVKETAKKKADEKFESEKIKLARCYELTDEMVRKGICPNTREARNEQVKELLAFNDESFVHLIGYVDRHPIRKEASVMPQVGVTEDLYLPAPQSQINQAAELSALWSGNTKQRIF